MQKTQKMIFSEDKFVNGKLAFEKGIVHDMPIGSVNRWLIRGGQLCDAKGKAIDTLAVEKAEAKEQAPTTETLPTEEKPEEKETPEETTEGKKSGGNQKKKNQ